MSDDLQQKVPPGTVDSSLFTPIEKLIILYEYATKKLLSQKEAYHTIYIQKGFHVNELHDSWILVDLDHRYLSNSGYDKQYGDGAMKHAFALAKQCQERLGHVHIAIFNPEKEAYQDNLNNIVANLDVLFPFSPSNTLRLPIARRFSSPTVHARL